MITHNVQKKFLGKQFFLNFKLIGGRAVHSSSNKHKPYKNCYWIKKYSVCVCGKKRGGGGGGALGNLRESGISDVDIC